MTNIRYVSAGEVYVIVAIADIVIEMFRSGKYDGPRENLEGFRPSRVNKNGTEVWSFQTSNAPAGKFGELVEYGDEYVIVIRDKMAISSVVRVNDFVHAVPATLHGKRVIVGGSTIEALFDIKLAIANELEIDYWKTPEEEIIEKARLVAAREAHKKLIEDQQAAKAAARAAREEAQRQVLIRNKVEAWSASGQHFFGIPIENDEEWKSLPKGTYCILMQDGTPVEAFTVVKENSRVSKGRTVEVSAEKPKRKEIAQASNVPEALDQVTVTIHGESRQVLVFERMDDLRNLQRSGLNSGTWVGVNPASNQQMTVYSVTKNSIDPVGKVPKQQPAAI